MALKLTTLEPVEIAGKSYTPNLTTEVKMRLRAASYKSEADAAEADEVLASAFPENKDEVLAVLRDKIPEMQKSVLQAYLLGGDMGVQQVMNGLKREAEANGA